MARDIASSEPGDVRRPSVLDVITFKAHRLAGQLDWVPDGFGDDSPVDETDGAAVRRAWGRSLRRWMNDNPEQMFAIRIGAVLLGGALLLMVLVISAF